MLDHPTLSSWTSLYQEPRTKEQLVIFKESLAAINLWYAHRLTTVYIVSGGEVDGLTYADKGWTSFEYLLANLVKTANTTNAKDWPLLLDLGYDNPEVGAGKRVPPAEPLAFYAGHAFGAKVYTNGADRDKIVAPKFRATIEEVLSSVQELNFNGAGWAIAEVEQLVAALPLCRRLTKLLLGRNQMGDEAMAVLSGVSARGALASLKRLALNSNQIGDTGMSALAGACANGALPALKAIDLQDNLIGDGGMQALSDSLSKGALDKVTIINLDYNQATGTGKKAIRDVAKARGFRVGLA